MASGPKTELRGMSGVQQSRQLDSHSLIAVSTSQIFQHDGRREVNNSIVRSPLSRSHKIDAELDDDSEMVNVRMATPDDQSPIGLTEVQRFSDYSIARSSIITSGVGRKS